MIGNLLRENDNIKNLLTKVAFFALLLLIAGVQIFGSFKGMSHRQSMEAAATGRELLRGNGLNNKVIYPVALFEKNKGEKGIDLPHHQNTYIAPGHAIVNAGVLSLIDGGNFEKHQVKAGDHVYFPDRALAIASLCFLLVSIGFSYLLVKQIFDEKIANTTAFIMLMSGSMWQYVQSCLPQMFLLMLFSIVLWLLHRALVIFEQEGRTPWLPLLSCAALFGIMALTKWLTLWIFAGYLAAILLRFKPRGAVTAISILVVGAFLTPAIIFNLKNFGSPFGQAGFTLVNSLTHSEELMLRNFGEEPVRLDGMILNFAKLTISQMSHIITLLGGFIVAPLFFLALIHNFQRSTTNQLKFAILLMWIPAVIGMSIFGGKTLDAPHQIHILFAPIMAAMGISVVAILWSRLTIAHSRHMMQNAHLYIIAILCAGPMLVSLPQLVMDTFESKGKGQPNAPYYQTAELTNELHNLANQNSDHATPLIFSDQPAATAWYSDLHSIALPKYPSQFEQIDNYASQQGTPITGIHTSAYSTRHLYENREYAAILPLVNLPKISAVSGIPAYPKLSSIAPQWQGAGRSPWEKISKAFPYSKSIVGSNRQEFKDFGHHTVHLRNKIDE